MPFMHRIKCRPYNFFRCHRVETSPELVSLSHGGEDSGMTSSDMNNNDFSRVDMEVENSNSDAAPLTGHSGDADDEWAAAGHCASFPPSKPISLMTRSIDAVEASPGKTEDKGCVVASSPVIDEAGDTGCYAAAIAASVVPTTTTASAVPTATVAFFQVGFDDSDDQPMTTSSKSKPPSLAAAFARSGKAGVIARREKSRAGSEERRKSPSSMTASTRARLPHLPRSSGAAAASARPPRSSADASASRKPLFSPQLPPSNSAPAKEDAAVGAWKLKRAAMKSKEGARGEDPSARSRDHRGHDDVADAKKKEREMKERTKKLVQQLEEVKKGNLEKQKKVRDCRRIISEIKR